MLYLLIHVSNRAETVALIPAPPPCILNELLEGAVSVGWTMLVSMVRAASAAVRSRRGAVLFMRCIVATCPDEVCQVVHYSVLLYAWTLLTSNFSKSYLESQLKMEYAIGMLITLLSCADKVALNSPLRTGDASAVQQVRRVI